MLTQIKYSRDCVLFQEFLEKAICYNASKQMRFEFVEI